MKKTWMAAGLAALLVLPLAGCGGARTGSNMTATPSAQPSPSATAQPDMMPDPEDGWDDLAGADGVVGGDDANGEMLNGALGAGNTGNDNTPGQSDNSPLEDLGDGVANTLDDMGAAARNMGRDARNAIEGR